MEQLSIVEQKKSLRKQIIQRRTETEFNVFEASGLAEQLIGLVSKLGSKKVACYLSQSTEPDTELFIDWALENHLSLVMPRSNADRSLTWVDFSGDTEPGIFVFPEPIGPETSLENVDLVIAPALAASPNGKRLGKGMGFYDRALGENYPLTVAVVFDEEVFTDLPTESHDQMIDAIVTPTQIIVCSSRFPKVT